MTNYSQETKLAICTPNSCTQRLRANFLTLLTVLLLDSYDIVNGYQTQTNIDDIVTYQFDVFVIYERLPEDGH